jgi:hypothetical protein
VPRDRLSGEQVAAARATVRERPIPVEWRRSISAQSAGAEHVIVVAVALWTQRKPGMFSFEPRRIPARLQLPLLDSQVAREVGIGRSGLVFAAVRR